MVLPSEMSLPVLLRQGEVASPVIVRVLHVGLIALDAIQVLAQALQELREKLARVLLLVARVPPVLNS